MGQFSALKFSMYALSFYRSSQHRNNTQLKTVGFFHDLFFLCFRLLDVLSRKGSKMEEFSFWGSVQSPNGWVNRSAGDSSGVMHPVRPHRRSGHPDDVLPDDGDQGRDGVRGPHSLRRHDEGHAREGPGDPRNASPRVLSPLHTFLQACARKPSV